jgi:predicted permease
MEAMGMRVHGRDFSWSDGPKSQQVVMINAAAARTYWPGEDAVGKVLMSGNTELHVIAVVDDVHASSVEAEKGWQIYYPVTQANPNNAQLVIRSQVPPATLAGSVLRALRELNPNQPAAEFQPIRTIVDRAVSPRRFFMLLVGIFAGLGLLLASLGIYGVVSYSVTQRTQEIGIRMALGASAGQVRMAVMRQTVGLALAGAVIGTVGAVGVSRLIESLLYGVRPGDAMTFAGVLVLLTGVAAVAAYLPARRASRIDPMVALRLE